MCQLASEIGLHEPADLIFGKILAEKINEMARLLGCQFIIATHSPFVLGILNAKIYDLDSKDFKVSSWTELENVRYFYDFFEKHKAEFEEE